MKIKCKKLTPRQLEILRYRSNGYLNKQIANELGICEDTVKEHISIALQKLNYKSVIQAVAQLVREEII
jgi:DNA-binding NarL/FixJ family response regulator